jgi:drug/metabolite transporter (DMT)-like permease
MFVRWALFALFIFREKLRGIFWLGLAITLTGAVLVNEGDSHLLSPRP